MSGLFEIRSTPLELGEVVQAVLGSGVGAVATFLGTVRDHNAGHLVTQLEYEAYPSMAEKQMRLVADSIRDELKGVKLAALHRVGSLSVGDAAVVCAASAAHRSEAFEACRRFIDRIKAEVPIWKREHGPEGPYWVGWEDARQSAHEHGPKP